MFLMHFFVLDTEFFLQPWVEKFHSSGKHLPKRRAKGSWSYLGNWMLKMKSPIMRASTEEILLHPACLVQASYVEATSIAQHAREQEGSPGVCNSSACCLCVFRDFWGRNVALCPKTLAEPFHLWFTSDFHGCPCWVGKQIVLLLDNIWSLLRSSWGVVSVPSWECPSLTLNYLTLAF